jgi:transcriptional regulator with XRE-family HTH domain
MKKCDLSVLPYRFTEAYKMREMTSADVVRRIGLPPQRELQIDAGLRDISVYRLCQMADVLNVSIDWLTGRTDNPEIDDQGRRAKNAARGKPQ